MSFRVERPEGKVSGLSLSGAPYPLRGRRQIMAHAANDQYSRTSSVTATMTAVRPTTVGRASFTCANLSQGC